MLLGATLFGVPRRFFAFQRIVLMRPLDKNVKKCYNKASRISRLKNLFGGCR